MKITKVSLLRGDWKTTKAMVTVEFDGCFVVSGLKIIEGQKGAFVSMPNRKLSDGTYKDTCFPITKEFREELIKAILDKYSGVENAEVFEDDDSSDSFPF